jgi:hypothetical protein
MSAHGEDLDALQIEHASLANRCRTLVTAFSNYQFKNAKARFYARSVIPWRLHILMRCTDSVFGKLPLEWTKFPNVDALADARIAVQAMVAETENYLRNLAWIWVQEAAINTPDGGPLPESAVGLGHKYKIVRMSLPCKFRRQLMNLNIWFERHEAFRHSVKHGVPFYQPDQDRTAESDLRNLWNCIIAAPNKQECAEARRSLEKMAHTTTPPWIEQPSGLGPIMIHAQLIADFQAIEMLSLELLDAVAERSCAVE